MRLQLNTGSTAKDVLEGRLYQPHPDSVSLPGNNVFLHFRQVVDVYRDLLAGGSNRQPEWVPFTKRPPL